MARPLAALLVAAALLLADGAAGKVARGRGKRGAAEAEAADLVPELRALQRGAADGVPHFDIAAFNRYAGGRKRPYTLILFCTAEHLADKPGLGLRELRKEFGYVGQAVRKENATHVFLADLEFKESQALFHRLGVQSLPWIFRIAPHQPVGEDGQIKLKHEDVMRHDDYGHGGWKAEDIAGYVRDRTGLKVDDRIERPSLLRSPAFPVLALGALGAGGAAAWQLYHAPFMRSLGLWTFGTLLVYWFSVSGGMHNIIRGVPLYYADQNGKVVTFMPNGQGQLGAEGFFMGTMGLAFALGISSFSFLLPRVKDAMQQKILGYGLIVLTGVAFNTLYTTYSWKTGYRWRTWL